MQQIHEVVEDIANVKDNAALASLGIDPCSSESSDDADHQVPGSTPFTPEVCKHSTHTGSCQRLGKVRETHLTLHLQNWCVRTGDC